MIDLRAPLPPSMYTRFLERHKVTILSALFILLFACLLLSQPRSSGAGIAYMSLVPGSSDIRRGEVITMTVMVKHVDSYSSGIDVTLKYDPTYLKIVPVNNRSQVQVLSGDGIVPLQAPGYITGSSGKYVDGSSSDYDLFTYESLDAPNGLYSFSAVADPGVSVGGNAIAGMVQFVALKPGNTAIQIVYDKDSKEDTNVAFNGLDILQKVNSSVLTIR